jgi:hypothetical protein
MPAFERKAAGSNPAGFAESFRGPPSWRKLAGGMHLKQLACIYLPSLPSQVHRSCIPGHPNAADIGFVFNVCSQSKRRRSSFGSIPHWLAARVSLPDRLLHHCLLLSFCCLLYAGCDGLRIMPAAMLCNDAVRLRGSPAVRIVLMHRHRVSQNWIDHIPSRFHAVFTHE